MAHKIQNLLENSKVWYLIDWLIQWHTKSRSQWKIAKCGDYRKKRKYCKKNDLPIKTCLLYENAHRILRQWNRLPPRQIRRQWWRTWARHGRRGARWGPPRWCPVERARSTIRGRAAWRAAAKNGRWSIKPRQNRRSTQPMSSRCSFLPRHTLQNPVNKLDSTDFALKNDGLKWILRTLKCFLLVFFLFFRA